MKKIFCYWAWFQPVNLKSCSQPPKHKFSYFLALQNSKYSVQRLVAALKQLLLHQNLSNISYTRGMALNLLHSHFRELKQCN